MEQSLEHEIRHLAYDMWRSAEIGFGQALDFWVMAEQMVIELTADSVRRANTATTLAFENIAAWPSALRALYLYRIRELARSMWSASSEQHNRSLDYWLAAEKHLRLLTESVARTTGASLGREEVFLEVFETFSPTNHLEQIRKRAYLLWESAGRQYSSTLDFWLAAEQKILDSLTTSEPASQSVEATPQPTRPKRSPKRSPKQRQSVEK